MIELNKEDREKLSRIARDLRPKVLDDMKLKFSLKSYDKILLFLNSYVFLLRLKDNINDFVIKGKLLTILYHYKNLYEKSINIMREYSSDLNFGKSSIKDKIEAFVRDNEIELNKLYNMTYPIGKMIRMYDPNRYGGIIE